MRTLRNNPILAALVAAGLILRIGWALLPHDILLLVLEDDAWMVTAIARNWALGNGITADGLTPTNGFHPLYPLTLGALPYLVAPNALEAGFRANLIICALLSTAQLVPLYGLLRRLARPALSLAGVAIIALNPYFVRASVNAMETSLALLTLTVLWWYGLDEAPLTPKRAAILGGLAALAAWARIDSLLAGAILGFVLLWRDVRARRNVAPTVLYGVVALGLMAPYFLRNLLVFGALSPSSGRALSYLHSYKESYTFSAGVQLLAYNPALDLSYLPAWALAGLIGLLLGMLWWLGRSVVGRLAPLLIYAGVLTFYYSYLQQQGSPRYYGSVAIVLVVALIAAAERLSATRAWAARPGVLAAAVAVFVAINSYEAVSYVAWQQEAPSASQGAGYATALWIRENLPQDAVLGAQNSGIMQYYSGRVVLNFDGKLNHEIIPVLEARGLDQYLASKGVGYIVDLPEVEDYITFYSARYTDAKPHLEPGTVGKLVIYSRLVRHKLGLGPAVELEERIPERELRPLSMDATIVHEAPLPNNPARAYTVYRLEPSFGEEP